MVSVYDRDIPHGRLPIDFAEAVVVGTDVALDRARADLAGAVSAAGMVDAAGVVASFNAVVRVADAAGIPLEEFKIEQTTDARAELGVDDWHQL